MLSNLLIKMKNSLRGGAFGLAACVQVGSDWVVRFVVVTET